MFRALHCTNDNLRRKFGIDCRRYGFNDKERRLCDEIDVDLAALGHRKCAAATAFSAALGGSFAEALGVFYVAEGSTLGNALLLGQAEAALGRACADANHFLSATAHRAGSAFQEFRVGLDRFGLLEPSARESVFDGARGAFRACGALLDSLA